MNEGSYGGRHGKDAMDSVDNLMANTRNNPIEELDMRFPVRCDQYELRPEPAAPGRWRGGIGIIRRNRFLVDGIYSCEGDRQTDPPLGIFGGWDGLVASCRKNPDTERGEEMSAKVTGIPFGPGEFVEFREPNAAGYGDPLERDPALVREDVLDDFTTVELARDAYGVVFTDERSLEIDEDATARLRDELRERPRFTSLTEYYAERGLPHPLRPRRRRATRSSAWPDPVPPADDRARAAPWGSPAASPVRRVRKAYEQVADQLRELIVRGELHPGDRLPVESALARDFGVSRATVREALRLLAAQSLVRTEKGATGGSYVTLPTAATISSLVHANVGLLAETRSVTLQELLEARELVEVPAVRLAAARRDADDLDRLRGTVPGDAARLSTTEEFSHNAEFHSRLLEASRNTLLVVSAQPIFSVLQTHLARSALGARFHRSIHEHHRRILAAVEAGDGDLAAAEMHDHLAFLRPYYEKAWRRSVAGRWRAGLSLEVGQARGTSGSPASSRSTPPVPQCVRPSSVSSVGTPATPARSASSRTVAIRPISPAS